MVQQNTLRKRENTRAQLISAGMEVFLRKGLAGARIDDVVKASGFTRGAFYSNYSAIEELMEDVIRTKSQEVFSEVERIFGEIPDPPSLEDIVAVIGGLREYGRDMYVLSTEYTLHQMRNQLSDGLQIITGTSPAEFVGGLIEDVLSRMGRISLIPTRMVAQVLSVLYMDSVVAKELNSESRTTPKFFEDVIRLTIESFTVPADEASVLE
ncbi:MAG: TetR/AcrR family transcriptional regulator [Arcanobacterium sp.]|nr:TetR/AcrR family transcriptional regulator [Arcanobacterium sp.]